MKKLMYNDIRGKLNFITHFNIGLYELREYSSLDVSIDYGVYLPTLGINLQREFCWTLEQKQEYILSCLKGIVEQTLICVVKERHSNFIQVIDGKQRLNALLEFYQGKFAINWQGIDYYINNIDVELNHFKMIYNIAYDYPDKKISDQQKIDWFVMINYTGTPQEKAHFDRLTKGVK